MHWKGMLTFYLPNNTDKFAMKLFIIEQGHVHTDVNIT